MLYMSRMCFIKYNHPFQHQVTFKDAEINHNILHQFTVLLIANQQCKLLQCHSSTAQVQSP